MKITNDYSVALRRLYAKTPKAVLAALAYSLAANIGPDAQKPESVTAFLLHEWQVLYDNGIVPQKPPHTRALQAATGRQP